MKLIEMEYINYKLVLRPFLCIFLLLLVFSCSTNADHVQVAETFDQEKEYELVITRKKEDGQSGASGLYTETNIKFEVEAVLGEGLKGTWIYGTTTLVGAQSDMIGAEEQEIINIYEGLAFELEVEKGVVFLKNYASIRNQLEQLFLKVYKIDSVSDDSGMYQRIKSMFGTKASNPQSLMNTFFPEIPLLFSTVGQEYKNSDVLVIDSIRSPYESSFIDIISTISVDKIDGEFEIIRKDSISQELLNEQMRMYMNEIFGEQSKDIPFSQMPQFNYRAQHSIWLNDDKKLTEMDKSMYLFNGGTEMSNSLTITIVED